MVDWDRVRRLRAQGLDWETIAADAKVGYEPPAGVEDAGRALKTLYLTRKSRSKRAKEPLRTEGTSKSSAYPSNPRSWILAVGLALVLGGALWLLVVVEYPSASVFVPAFPPALPDVLLVIVAGAILIGLSLVLEFATLGESWKKGVALGICFGLAISGVAGLVVYSEGIPNLSSHVTPSVGAGWEKAPNSLWEKGGKPVVFFYGSEACPFCSASSWAMYLALQHFGSWSGTSYSSSNPGDIYPNTPEIGLSGSSLASSYLAWDPYEDPYNQQIIYPSTPAVEHAYVTVYASGIPFLVAGGLYIHTTTFVNPATLAGLSDSQVASSLQSANPNDPTYSAIENAAVYLEAYCAKICELAGITPPTTVTSDSTVASILAQIG